jgi:Zn-dependent peptidase ImmA (M78 family)
LAVILNSSHPKTRQANTLMHEIAHIELKHVPNRVELSELGLLLLSDFSVEQEEEADWLAGSLLLPRNGLMRHRARGASANGIAQIFGVSDELCTWRLRMTGIDRQLGVGKRSPFR